MLFNYEGYGHESAFSGLIKYDNYTTHGSLFCLSQSDVPKMDSAERWYQQAYVDVTNYDGKKFSNVKIYKTPEKCIPKINLELQKESKSPCISSNKVEEYTPSKRYLNILIRGAKQLGLDPNYIKRLEATKTYEPTYDVIQMRQNRPKPQDLKQITVEELARHNSKNASWVSVLGYIVDPGKVVFSRARGRDLTTRYLLQWYDIPMDRNDDR